jgi:sulfate permease, SulP family
VLWKQLHSAAPPRVIDVREPREFQRGHIPQACSIPLYQLLSEKPEFSRDAPLVFVCQGGRRASRAAYVFGNQGYDVHILEGGMLAWGNAGLLEAVD